MDSRAIISTGLITSSAQISLPPLMEYLLEAAAKEVIAEIKALNYLGAANKEASCDLAGYYLNITRRWMYDTETQRPKMPSTSIFFTLAAALELTGAGNCGELVRMLMLKIYLRPELTVQQKQSVVAYCYETGNHQQRHSYVVIGSKVYDLWLGQVYPFNQIEKRTGVPFPDHDLVEVNPNICRLSVSQLSTLYFAHLKKLKEYIEEQTDLDKGFCRFYPSLDNKDTRKNVFLVRPALSYLYNKILRTFTDDYYLIHSELAETIRKKIINDYIFMICCLKQNSTHDAKGPPVAFGMDEACLKIILGTEVNNNYLVDYVVALTYEKTNPNMMHQKLHALEELIREGNRNDSLTNWIEGKVKMLTTPLVEEAENSGQENRYRAFAA